jgi:16S rRNA (cytosine1402-N4)-methyltransferase
LEIKNWKSENDMETIHKTVLLEETVDALEPKDSMVVVDATLGGGGHSTLVLKKIGQNGKLIAFDQDAAAISRFKERLRKQELGKLDENIFLVHENFSKLKDSLLSLGISSVDAIMADLGISSDQLEDGRGISFLQDDPLDMRMDQRSELTAEKVINTYSQEQLAKIIREYSDEKFASKIASKIVEARIKKEITTTKELVDVIAKAIPEKFKHQKIHFATKTFQALRIEVNRELTILETFVSQAVEMLKPKGRLAVITFHSGEDAIIKKAFRENARGCICPPQFPVCRCGNSAKVKVLTRKPILPSDKEVQENPRSRSAKLRVIEKL